MADDDRAVDTLDRAPGGARIAVDPGEPPSALEVAFTIVDDPSNGSVYKGAGSYAATRGETAIRLVVDNFPLLRFSLSFEKDLRALHARARIDFPLENDVFLLVLASALTSTGTRLMPDGGARP